MSRSWESRVNFERVCQECDFYQFDKKQAYPHHCTRKRDVVTGAASRTTCQNARTRDGICGPEARHYTPRQAIVKIAAE